MLKLLKPRVQTSEYESNKSDNHSLSFEINNSLASKYVDKYFWIGRQVSLANLYQPLNTLISVLFLLRFLSYPTLIWIGWDKSHHSSFSWKKMLTSSFNDPWLILPSLDLRECPCNFCPFHRPQLHIPSSEKLCMNTGLLPPTGPCFQSTLSSLVARPHLES